MTTRWDAQCARFNYGGRSVGGLAMFDQRPTDCRQVSDAHVHHQRARKPRQGRPVNPWLAGLLRRLSFWIGVAGHEGHGRGRASVSDRDAGKCSGADARGNARHDLESDAMTNEELGLFGTSSKDQRIAPLEPDNHPPSGCMLEQDLVDLVLVERAMPA